MRRTRVSQTIFRTRAAGVSRASRPPDLVAKVGVDRVDEHEPLTVPQRVALAGLRLYQLAFSPLFAGSCRFLPSCSQYAAEAIRRHGVCRGTLLAAARLGRCHPFAESGVDPVPGHRPRV